MDEDEAQNQDPDRVRARQGWGVVWLGWSHQGLPFFSTAFCLLSSVLLFPVFLAVATVKSRSSVSDVARLEARRQLYQIHHTRSLPGKAGGMLC